MENQDIINYQLVKLIEELNRAYANSLSKIDANDNIAVANAS